ncbi:MAG: acylphosphatase [Chloroflexota bacterium]|nr:acylphosphatase [Chloroflexota bacterium]
MSEQATLHATIYGVVQGVNFRAFTARHARELGLTGYVRNLLLERAVEVVAEGDRDSLLRLLRLLEEGPRGAWVERVDVEWSGYKRAYSRFEVAY